MDPALLGDPLLAWRDESTLQIGWGAHSVIVKDAPRDLPAWLQTLTGEASTEQLLRQAKRHGLKRRQAQRLLTDLRNAGLLGTGPVVRVSVAARSLAGEALREALRGAGVEIVHNANVVVFPQGQLPTLVTAPSVRRLLPVWFGARAVHVGPVIDDLRGPCTRCVDLHCSDADPAWPDLVAQAGTIGSWTHPAQMVQAAGLIAMLATAREAIGLEMIVDPQHPGPRWRIWTPHPKCACRG